MFDWDDARYFLAIARARSLTAAGRVLGVRQSTVGRRLAAFEAVLGARLFERKTGGFALTDAGNALLGHAERIESEALSAERTLAGRPGDVAGVVRVTAPQAFGNQFVMPRLARLRARRPELVIELVADNTNLSLTQREADLAIRIGRPVQPGLVVRRLGTVVTGLYAARAYATGRARLRDGLAGHDAVDLDDSYLQKDMLAWFRHAARGAQIVVRANGTHGIAAAVQAGLGVGPLPCWLGDTMPDLRRVLAAQALSQDLWLVMHRDLRRSPRVRAVTEFVIAEIARAAPLLLGSRRAAA